MLTPGSANALLGATQQFTATVSGTTNTAVNWTVDGVAGGNSTVGTISASGLYTAPANLPSPSTVTVRATSVADPGKSANATVTVQSDVAVAVMPGAASVELGATQQFTATVSSGGSPNPAVTWAVNGVAGGSAVLGTIDPGGLYTAPAILPSPTMVNITATSVADPAKSAMVTATVTSNLTVSVSGPASVNNAASAQFVATVTPVPMSNPNLGVVWSVNGVNGGNAMFGTIDANGFYTAPLVAPAQPNVTVAATSVADASKSGSAVVLINAVISVTISPSAMVTVALEGMQSFDAVVAGTVNQNVVWDVNGILGGNQSTVGAITNPGTGTATYFAPVNMPAPGTVITVRAVSQVDPAQSASVTVNLTSNIVVAAATLSGATSSVRAVGRRETICAAIANTANSSLTWRVNGILNGDTTVGQIVPPLMQAPPCPALGPSGSLIFAMDYLAPAAVPAANPVTVTVTSAADPAKTASVQITVVIMVTVSVTPDAITLPPGASQQFTATVLGSTDQSVTWTVAGAGCSGMPCGAVSAAGLYTASPTAVAMAVDTVTATSSDGGATDSAAVTISTTAPVISGLQPASVSAGAVSSFPLKVLGVNFTGASEILLDGVALGTTCASSNECTATIAAAELAAPASRVIEVQIPGSPAEVSNAVTLEVVAPVQNEEVIQLEPATPQAAGKDISVVDILPVSGARNNIILLGVLQNSSCVAGSSPVQIARPASGTATVSLCLGGADHMQVFTLTGPSPPDIVITSVQPLVVGLVDVQITLQVPSTAQPGLRTLFAEDSNKNKTAAMGAILVQ